MCMTNRYWANTVVVISENINLLNHSARILQTYRQTDRHRAVKKVHLPCSSFLESNEFMPPATAREKGTPTPTQFWPMYYCGQMTGWMKTPLGTEVDLDSGHHVVLSDTVNMFKSRLDKFWQHQDVIYDFKAEIHGTGSRSCY